VVSRAYLGSFVRYRIRVPDLPEHLIVDDHRARVNGIMSGEVWVGLKASDSYVFPGAHS
jgi:hypothetical protein